MADFITGVIVGGIISFIVTGFVVMHIWQSALCQEIDWRSPKCEKIKMERLS